MKMLNNDGSAINENKSAFWDKCFNIMMLVASLLGFIFATSTQSLAGVEQKHIITKKNQWTALSSLVNGKKICYAINYSYQSIGNAKLDRNAKSYIDVDYLGKKMFKFSIHFTKKLGTNSTVFLNVDDEQFELVSHDDFAFFTKYENDERILELLTSGQKVTARATYSDETYSVDTFDITRFEQVRPLLKENCKING